MRLPRLAQLDRMRKGSHQHPAEYQVVARYRAPDETSRDELEAVTEHVLDLLLEDARDTVLGPAAACNFEMNEIVVEFSVCATSVEDLHRHVGNVLSLLEARGPFCYHDSTTSRADEREPVPA